MQVFEIFFAAAAYDDIEQDMKMMTEAQQSCYFSQKD